MKIPEPIMEPATSMVESSKPSPRTNFSSVTAGVAVMLSFKRIYPLACRVPSRNIVWKLALPVACLLQRRTAIFEKGKLAGRHRQHAKRVRSPDPAAHPVLRGWCVIRPRAIDVAIRCRARGRAFACGRFRRRFEFYRRDRVSAVLHRLRQTDSRRQWY
jgi:hypothetical protein